MRLPLAGLLLLAFLAGGCDPGAVDAPPATDSPVAGWPVFGGNEGGTRFSPLTQITPENDDQLEVDSVGINERENSMLHVLDMGGNYWALWTEGENLKNYYQKYPDGINTLQQRLGYRVRPSWIWQRKRYGTSEIVLAIANDGVSGVPGILRVYLESLDGKISIGGGLHLGMSSA